MPLHLLPELLGVVFSFVARAGEADCARVSQRWCHAVITYGREDAFLVMVRAASAGALPVLTYVDGLGVRWNPTHVLSFAGTPPLSVARWLVAKGADVHARHESAMRLAARSGHLDVLRYLIEECGADRHAQRDDALRQAAMGGHLEVVKYLVEAPGGGEWKLDVIVTSAARGGQLAIVRYLMLTRGARADPMAFRLSARRGRLATVKFLMLHAPQTYTPRVLYVAAGQGHLDIVKFLVSAKPGVGNLIHAAGMARAAHHDEVVEFLTAQ